MVSLIVLATCLTSALAAPTLQWTPALGEYYTTVDRHIQAARQAGALNVPSCDMSKAVMPASTTPLPAPEEGWTLSEVVIGRGTQNYTCASADINTKPVAVGAVANLYNVSCIAANYPDILSMLPGLVLQYPLPAANAANLEPSNLFLTGHHYFSGNGTPTFDLTVDTVKDLGIGRFKKGANATAPTDAPKGQNGVGDGAVPWLFLPATPATDGNLAAVYRLNTAGGNAPKTCQSSPAYFTVEYAAEYWFYSKSS